MVLHEDIRTHRGDLLIASGHDVTELVAERIWNFTAAGRVPETVDVLDSYLPHAHLRFCMKA